MKNRIKLYTELLPQKCAPKKVVPTKSDTHIVTEWVTISAINSAQIVAMPAGVKSVSVWTEKFACVTFDGSTPSSPEIGHFVPGNTVMRYNVAPATIMTVADAGASVYISFYK
jgi:hypothetical protein